MIHINFEARPSTSPSPNKNQRKDRKKKRKKERKREREKRKKCSSHVLQFTVASLRSIPRKFSHRWWQDLDSCDKLERKILKRLCRHPFSFHRQRQKSISVAARSQSGGNDDTIRSRIIKHSLVCPKRIIFPEFFRKIQWGWRGRRASSIYETLAVLIYFIYYRGSICTNVIY